MKFKIILALSLLLNLAAISYLYTTNAASNTANNSDSTASVNELSGDQLAQLDSGLYPAYQHSDLTQLRRMGLSDKQASMLILQELKAENVIRLEGSLGHYWQADNTEALAQQIEAKIEAERALRDTLTGLFDDPNEVDKTLQETSSELVPLSFLTSRDQIALREYQLRAQKNTIAAELASRVDELVSAEILTEAGALEYRLRYSSLAARLVNSGVSFSEQSFRDSYVALAPIYDSQQGYAFDANTLMAQRNKLKQLMGHEDALKILANLDNRFAQFKAAGERYYLTESQILAAYQIISDSEEEMIEGYFVRQTDPQQGIKMIRAAAQSREEKLAAYLGEDISRSLMRAFTRARPDPTTPAGILLSGY
ncbi:MAG: hypothetical protein P8Q91_06860 [Porticoccaceae bacterium]|jgi:hypothetical protein|nr:hypothetical protein [Porticoccaceae bacterium]